MYVWETFEIDDLMTRFGSRVFGATKSIGSRIGISGFILDRMALDYKKKILKDPAYHEKMTTLVEFARGGETPFIMH